MGYGTAQQKATTQAPAAPQETTDPDVDSEHDQERARRVSTAALHRERSKRKAPNGGERVEHLIAILDRQVKVVTKKLDGASHGLDPGEVVSMKRSLSEERDSLMRLSSNVASDDPLLLEALESAERAQTVIMRLDALGRAESARSSTAEIAHTNEQERQDLAAASARKSPEGYCDVSPSRVEPCHLSEQRRIELRAQIRFVVNEASSSWKSAIVSAQVAEKLKQQTPSFEMQLGQLMLGLLFGVVGNIAKGLVAKGVGKADAALGHTDNVYGVSVQTGGMDPDSKKLFQGAGNMVVDKATPIAQAKMQQGITAQQLAENAKQAVAVPNDKQTFLASLESAPTAWAGSINANLNQLLDGDLEALHGALPPAETFSITYFENKIAQLVKRFEEQVLAVKWWEQTKPCQVVTADGRVRYALIAPEMEMNKELHGEWKYSEVQTGKWSFIRWLDDDMSGMASQRAIQHDGAAAGALIRSADDASFWSTAAMARIKDPANDKPQHD